MVVLRILVIFLDDFAMPWWWLCEITATTNFQKIWVLAFLLFKGVTFKLSYTDFEYFHLFLLCRGGVMVLYAFSLCSGDQHSISSETPQCIVWK